jgi:hypothetical protein
LYTVKRSSYRSRSANLNSLTSGKRITKTFCLPIEMHVEMQTKRITEIPLITCASGDFTVSSYGGGGAGVSVGGFPGKAGCALLVTERGEWASEADIGSCDNQPRRLHVEGWTAGSGASAAGSAAAASAGPGSIHAHPHGFSAWEAGSMAQRRVCTWLAGRGSRWARGWPRRKVSEVYTPLTRVCILYPLKSVRSLHPMHTCPLKRERGGVLTSGHHQSVCRVQYH